MLREYCPRCDSYAIVLCSECGGLCCLEHDLISEDFPCQCGHHSDSHGPAHTPELNKESAIERLKKVWERQKRESV